MLEKALEYRTQYLIEFVILKDSKLLESSYAIYHHASIYGFGRLMTIGSRQRRAFGGSGNPTAFQSFLVGWSQ